MRETSESCCFVSCKRDPGERELGTFTLTDGDSLCQCIRHPTCVMLTTSSAVAVGTPG